MWSRVELCVYAILLLIFIARNNRLFILTSLTTLVHIKSNLNDRRKLLFYYSSNNNNFYSANEVKCLALHLKKCVINEKT